MVNSIKGGITMNYERSLKEELQITLGKMYREMALTSNEIKLILKNPIEIVIKCELTVKDERIYYRFYLQNDASGYTGELI